MNTGVILSCCLICVACEFKVDMGVILSYCLIDLVVALLDAWVGGLMSGKYVKASFVC